MQLDEIVVERKPYAPYRLHAFICTNVRPPGHVLGCCSARGSEALKAHLAGRIQQLGIKEVRINTTPCLNRCRLGPIMVIYPEGVWYAYRDVNDVEEILQSHVLAGKPVERLMLYSDGTVGAAAVIP